MVRVVLVWNEHPTEVVAGYHARKVARILREKYGHEVIVEKIPVRETNYGIVARAKTAKEAAHKLPMLKASITIANEIANYHNAPAFNFHSSPAHVMGQALRRSPWRFRLEQSNHDENAPPLEISIRHRDLGSTVEIPAIYSSHPTPTAYLLRLAKVRENIKSDDVHSFYHTLSTPLRASEQRKYLSDKISKKIAAAIHERITKN